MHRLIVVGCVLLAGCATGGHDGEGRYYPQIPPGSSIELQQALAVPNGWARSFVQFGLPVAPRDRDLWSLYCDVEVQQVQQGGAVRQEIRPGRFTVTRIDWLSDTGLSLYISVARGAHDDAPSNVHFTTRLRLHSADQPEVRAMSCTHRIDHLFYPRQPTLKEIRTTLGGVAQIILPADSATANGDSAPAAD